MAMMREYMVGPHHFRRLAGAKEYEPNWEAVRSSMRGRKESWSAEQVGRAM